MTVVGVPGAQIRSVAPRIRHLLEHFTENGRYTVEDILDQIERQERQCWLVMDGDIRAVAITSISAERFKTCRIESLAGEGLKEWADAYTEIENWARAMGCAKIEALARPGYARVGRRFGLKQTHVMLEKDL